MRVERLETRRLLATFDVTTTDDANDLDPGDGVCQIVGGGCSLRAAIQEANALGTTTPHRINVPAGDFNLTIEGTDENQALTGDLNLRRSMTILGSGPEQTIIDAGGLDRVFDVVLGNVILQGLTIQGGFVSSEEDAFEFYGGGIRNEANLTLVDTVVTGNVAASGAGVANYNGDLTVERSVVRSNGSENTLRGGGIFNHGYYDTANLELTETTISGNQANRGGGIMNDAFDGEANTTIRRSTISGNTADTGGGVSNLSIASLYPGTVSAIVSLRNTTLSGNTANDSGGGLHSQTNIGGEAIADILNTTITGNAAVARDGGGILSVDSSATATEIRSTIVYGNTAGRDGNDMLGVTIMGSFNLIGDPSGHSIIDREDDNIVGLDPRLGPLTDNGGPTQTHALRTGSAAIDQGINSLTFDNDQRGNGFLRTVDNPTITNARDGTDIGAVEVGQVAPTFDFGDAPDGIADGGLPRVYPTLLTNDGARHRIDADGPFLGRVRPDAESDGQTNSAASGDDLVGVDDEDAFPDGPLVLNPGEPIQGIVIQHDGGDEEALLNVWLDLNLDGDWDDPGEQIFVDRLIPAGPSQTSLSSFTVPANTPNGNSYFRARVSTAIGLGPAGEAPDGEVEDVAVTIGSIPIPTADLSLTQIVNNSEPVVGETIQFTITVTNSGPDRATNVEVTNLLPNELFFERATVSQGVYEFEETWFLDALDPGASAVLEIFATVDIPETMEHTAEITFSDQFDPNSTPGNGISGEDDQATVTLGTCLGGGPLHIGVNRVTYACATPGAFVGFVHGTIRGSSQLDQFNVSVDIADAGPAAVAIADANGVASALIRLTQEQLQAAVAESGDPLIVQAFEMFPQQRKSNTLSISDELLLLKATAIGSGATPLDASVLPSITESVVNRWLQTPLTVAQHRLLQNARIHIVDLPGAAIGRAIGSTILLDVDAAGNGWFVDPTPDLDEEYMATGSIQQLVATSEVAAQRIDLVTTLLHEYGHILGLPDEQTRGSLMSHVLDVGIRRLPPATPVSGNGFDVNRDGFVSALDALVVINWLGRNSLQGPGAGWIDPGDAAIQFPRLDSNRDSRVTALDALSVINRLASHQVEAEFESDPNHSWHTLLDGEKLSGEARMNDDALLRVLQDDELLRLSRQGV